MENTWKFLLLGYFFLVRMLADTNASVVGNGSQSCNPRLPSSLDPINYQLELLPRLTPPWDIQGKLNLTFEVLEPTDRVTLNMLDIISKNETVKLIEVATGKNIPILRQSYSVYCQIYIIELSQELQKGSSYSLLLEYQGLLNDKLVGFYRSSYKKGNETIWLASTQFSPTDARRAFPGFDEPKFKSTYDITLVHHPNMTAHSNMEVKTSTKRSDGLIASTFHTTPIMSTFIVVFHISDFVSLSKNLNPVEFKVWSRKDVLNQTSYAFDMAPKALKFLENYFNFPYQLPKLDMIAVPDFKFNAMENWGFITYRETALLVEGDSASPAAIFNVAYIICHELAHQWFGNLVTPSWWSELWLKEGFASYMGYLALDQVERDWSVMDKFISDYKFPALTLDSLENSHPINVPVDHPNQIGEIFDAISYRKGASLLSMAYHFVGPEAFKQALSNYLSELQYSSASQEDLWNHLTRSSNSSLPTGVSVGDIMDTWTYKSGYPLISVSKNKSGLHFKQEQFLIGTSNSSKNNNYAWWVPISFTKSLSSNFESTLPSFWLKNSTEATHFLGIEIQENEWYMVNLKSSGFYRVNYDEKNWNLLARQLERNHTGIPPSQRATLINDALTLAKSGRMKYDQTLHLINYLSRELHFVPWEAATGGFTFIYRLLMQDEAFGDLKKFLLTLVVPWYRSLGFSDGPNDSFPVRSARQNAVLWACQLKHSDCVEKALALFEKWIANSNESESVPPFVREIAICSGVASGSEEIWDKVWHRYSLDSSPSEKLDILKGLGCSKDPWILHRYLVRAFNSESGIRKHDTINIFNSIVSNPIGENIAWKFLHSNWLHVFKYLGSNNAGLGSLLQNFQNHFHSDFDKQKVESFGQTYKDSLGAATRTLRQTLEAIENNAQWMQLNYQQLTSWLKENNKKIDNTKV